MDNQILTAIGKSLVSLAIIFVPVIATWATNLLKQHIHSSQQLLTIEKVAKFAQDAVTLAEKDGVAQGLTGNEKFKQATTYVQNMLNSLGITNVDISLIQGAVERAFASSKELLENVYNTDSLSKDTEKVSTPQESTTSVSSDSKETVHTQQ